jgi:hypothetical protein
MSEERITRRDIIKKAAYVAPIIFTVPASFPLAPRDLEITPSIHLGKQ